MRPLFGFGWSLVQNVHADLADRGYLSGYGDGLMKPDNEISACETLVLLSRFYSPGEEATALIKADYEGYVSETVAASLTWHMTRLKSVSRAGDHYRG